MNEAPRGRPPHREVRGAPEGIAAPATAAGLADETTTPPRHDVGAQF